MDQYTTAGSLLGIGLLQSLTAIKTNDPSIERKNLVGGTVCTVAFFHYMLMIYTDSERSTIRYADWFITLPLLFFECVLLCDVDIPANVPSIMTCVALLVLMLIFGKIARGRKSAFALAFLCLVAFVAIFVTLLPQKSSTNGIVTLSVVSTWFLYGVAEWYGSERTLNSLDVLNKALFGLFVVLSSWK